MTKQIKKIIICFSLSLLSICLFPDQILAESSAYPAPPSQETIDKWKEMGRANELKYGSGNTTAPVVVKSPTNSPTPSPSPIPSPSPTPSPSPSPIPLITEPTNRHNFVQDVNDFFKNMKNWLIQWIFRFANQDKQIKNSLEATNQPTPSPTLTQEQSQVEEYYWQGFDIWVKTKDYKKASEYYLKALAINPDYAPALSSYGYIRGAFYGEYQKAEEYLTRAMNIDPEWAYAPYNLGLLFTLQGYEEKNLEIHKKGIVWIQYAVDHFPNHPDNSWFRQHLKVAQEEEKDVWGN